MAVHTNAIMVSVSGWVSDGPVAALAVGKSSNEFDDARPKVNRQAEDCAQLDDDGKHLPVAIAKIDAQERFGDAQMRGRADGKKFG